MKYLSFIVFVIFLLSCSVDDESIKLESQDQLIARGLNDSNTPPPSEHCSCNDIVPIITITSTGDGCCTADIFIPNPRKCGYVIYWQDGLAGPQPSIPVPGTAQSLTINSCENRIGSFAIFKQGEFCLIKEIDCNGCQCGLNIQQSYDDPCVLWACPDANCTYIESYTWTQESTGETTTVDFSDINDCGRLEIDQRDTYCVEVTDVNGCTASSCITVDDCGCLPTYNYDPSGTVATFEPWCTVNEGITSFGYTFTVDIGLTCNECCQGLKNYPYSLTLTKTRDGVETVNSIEGDVTRQCDDLHALTYGRARPCHFEEWRDGDHFVIDAIIDVVVTGCEYNGPTQIVIQEELLITQDMIDACCM